MEDLTTEDLGAIKAILESYRLDGVVNPLLPADIDEDRDGITDAYGLDEDGNVILVLGATLTDTVYLADGEEGE